jgi:hypothetical protein
MELLICGSVSLSAGTARGHRVASSEAAGAGGAAGFVVQILGYAGILALVGVGLIFFAAGVAPLKSQVRHRQVTAVSAVTAVLAGTGLICLAGAGGSDGIGVVAAPSSKPSPTTSLPRSTSSSDSGPGASITSTPQPDAESFLQANVNHAVVSGDWAGVGRVAQNADNRSYLSHQRSGNAIDFAMRNGYMELNYSRYTLTLTNSGRKNLKVTDIEVAELRRAPPVNGSRVFVSGGGAETSIPVDLDLSDASPRITQKGRPYFLGKSINLKPGEQESIAVAARIGNLYAEYVLDVHFVVVGIPQELTLRVLDNYGKGDRTFRISSEVEPKAYAEVWDLGNAGPGLGVPKICKLTKSRQFYETIRKLHERVAVVDDDLAGESTELRLSHDDLKDLRATTLARIRELDPDGKYGPPEQAVEPLDPCKPDDEARYPTFPSG